MDFEQLLEHSQAPIEPQELAMYGIDIILSDHNEPLVLEVQWAPDCAQAVVQNPSFWNEILGGLFLNDFEKFVAI